MSPLKAGRVRDQLAVVLDDNVNVSVPAVLAFEQALLANPNDRAARQAYHDWLLEQGCPTRAGQLAQGVTDQQPRQVYEGAVRPGSREDGPYYLPDWAGY